MADAKAEVRRDNANPSYDLTIHGLFRKRDELLARLEQLRDETAATMNTLASVEHVLKSFGAEVEAMMAKPRPRTTFYLRHEMRKALLDALRTSKVPLSSRDLAGILLEQLDRDTTDRKLMRDLTARVSKSVCILLNREVVRRITDATGKNAYELAR